MTDEQGALEPVPELEPMIDAAAAPLPQFATVIWGYDRGQVNDYVARLNEFVADEIRRNELLTEEIEQRKQRPSAREPYEGVGERIETILRLAADEADALRERGVSQAAELVESARREHEQLIQSAERDLQAVGERRDAVVAELRKVQDVLATLGLPAEAVESAEAAAGEAASAETTVIKLRNAAAGGDSGG
jgi:hypothetical protein